MAITPITTNKQIGMVKKLMRSKKPQKYLNEGTYIAPKINIIETKTEYFSPFASTGVKLNRTVHK